LGSWKDKVTNENVLRKKEESLHFACNLVRRKLAYAEVLRGSSGSNASLLMEGKFEAKSKSEAY